ncbi:MAG: response regulator transcription factor [Eubacteriales bacterium]|nr:response regulator transcription factor [Eubacteriales bacterium]
MEQIMIVEDDRTLNEGLCKTLKKSGYPVVSCLNLASARDQLLCGAVSLVLLDVNLPDGSGLDFLKEMKKKLPELPVLLLTANDTDFDIVEGLECGADDYITKPFSLSVLRARIRTQLRKARRQEHEAVFRQEEYSFDFERMLFQVDGEPVELSKTEQKLLRILVENAGTTVSRGTLVDRIWTDGAEYVEENALSVTVKRLRDKLRAQRCIRTVYGIGYRWQSQDDE